MKYFQLKVLPGRLDPTSLNYKSGLLAVLNQALLEKQSLSTMIESIQAWNDGDPFSYKQWIQTHIKGVPTSMDEVEKRLAILRKLNETEEDGVLPLEDEHYKTLWTVFSDRDFKWPVTEEAASFYRDLKAAGDQDSMPLREIHASDLETEESDNGKVTSLAGRKH